MHVAHGLSVRDGRIELPSSVWKTDVLPLNESRNRITLHEVSHITKIRPKGGFLLKNAYRYFTASFKVFDARNFGTRMDLIWIVAPVRGLRPVRPARVFASKMPRPAIETSSPRFKQSVIMPMIASTARSASAFVEPIVACTLSTKSILFAIRKYFK